MFCQHFHICPPWMKDMQQDYRNNPCHDGRAVSGNVRLTLFLSHCFQFFNQLIRIPFNATEQGITNVTFGVNNEI
jgi:hypothetical protein